MDTIGIILIVLAALVAAAVLVIIVFVIAKKVSNLKKDKKRTANLLARENSYNDELKLKGINKQASINIHEWYEKKNYIYKRNVFNISFDYIKRIIALCSFESDPYKVYYYNFSDIISAKIIDGIRTSQRDTISAGVIGGDTVLGGFSRSISNEKQFVKGIKIKIEFSNPYFPAQIISLYSEKLDTTSDEYQEIAKTVEDIESMINKVTLLK